MTVVTDAYTELANLIEMVAEAEFRPDHPYLTIRHDRIHESLGSDGKTWIGISPDDQPVDGLELHINLLIQFYDPFRADVDPFQHVDPRIITNKAERMRRALQSIRTTGLPELWFFDLVSTSFPNDATGNKSRFEMSIVARGNDSGLIETTG